MSKISARMLFTLCLLLLMTVALCPAAGAPQTTQTTTPTVSAPPTSTVKIPSGSYMVTCNTCEFSGTSYSCKCGKPQSNSSDPEMVSTKIDLTTCTVDSSGFYNLTNNYGTLICSTS